MAEIVEKKKARLNAAISAVPLGELKNRMADLQKPRDFYTAIKGLGGIRLIAELKKASPSRGVIRPDFDPAVISRIYREKADAVSVLTEEEYFLGRLDYIKIAKEHSARPVLRKDFIFNIYQIYESRAAGADAILLIEDLLETSQASEYLRAAEELGMTVLFEVHDLRGLEKAMNINAPVIGINNRDLRTMKTDIETTFKIKKEIPSDRVVVSESGIRTAGDVNRLEEAGVDAVLIGTAFMEARDIKKKMEEMFSKWLE